MHDRSRFSCSVVSGYPLIAFLQTHAAMFQESLPTSIQSAANDAGTPPNQCSVETIRKIGEQPSVESSKDPSGKHPQEAANDSSPESHA